MEDVIYVSRAKKILYVLNKYFGSEHLGGYLGIDLSVKRQNNQPFMFIRIVISTVNANDYYTVLSLIDEVEDIYCQRMPADEFYISLLKIQSLSSALAVSDA